MGKLYVCNYADSLYAKQQQENTSSAYLRGMVDKVLEFHEEDIADLKAEYPEHFKIKRGGGLWLWKPHIILKALGMIDEGDYLFYCDTGAIFINDLHKLLPDFLASGKDLMLVEQPLLASCFTKKECYHLMNCEDWSGNQVLSGYILMRKSKVSIAYMEEWLKNMKDIRKAHGQHYLPEIKEFKRFIAHREDQSVLDILRRKWGIEAHRDLSDFGEFPWQYMPAGGYHRRKYSNSHYPTILLCVRKQDPQEYEKKYRKEVRLHRLGLNNEFLMRVRLTPVFLRMLGRRLADGLGLGNVLNRMLSKNIK